MIDHEKIEQAVRLLLEGMGEDAVSYTHLLEDDEVDRSEVEVQ